MTTHDGDAPGLVPAASTATTRTLRPRQAPGVRGSPAGSTAPRGGGRVTRSSAVLAQTTPTKESHAVPQPSPLRTSGRSHKRSQSSSAGVGRQSKRTRQSRHEPGFYGEDSDSGDEANNPYITPGSDVEQKTNTRRQRKTTRPSSLKKSTTPPRQKKSPRRPAAATLPAFDDNNTVVEDAIIPAWITLPYLILVQIFQYAAAPLTELHQARWLTAASGICRAFLEPALTALYEAPPLFTRPMAHGFVSLLSKDPSTTLIKYRPKVRELWIDVEHIASKTYKGQPLDFKALVGYLPRLEFIQFYHSKDDPPYRSLDGTLRWHYPTALFQALNGIQDNAEETSTTRHAQLAAWQWNRRLMAPELDLAGIKKMHQTPAFVGLKTLSFVNYQVPSLHAKASADDAELAALDQAFIQDMAKAITALPDLQHLAMESSTAANDQLLPLLPKTLRVLELVNCWDVNGEDFASYLLSSGHQLRQLILLHNQSLNLSFLTVLGTACPNLQALLVDCKTFNHHEFYHDSDPSYDELLTAEQTPEWPENLESLQLLNMKKWTAEAAETLFQSLIDSAPKLLNLRRLDLKAMLDIPIQQRSQLRNKWERKLKQIFLREKGDTLPLFSLRKQQIQPTEGEKAAKKSRKRSRSLAAENPSRRSSRIAVKWSNPSSRASSVGRDLRHGLNRPSYAEPDTDEDEDDEEDGLGGGKEEEEDGGTSRSGVSQPPSPTSSAGDEVSFRHGMCEKVEIQLDNQKSAERTLTMDDFLDSGDEDLADGDWVGEDEEYDDGPAW